MPPEQVGIAIIGTAMTAAVVFGAMAADFSTAAKSAFAIWVLQLLAQLLWGPPSPYYDFGSMAVVAVSRGIVLYIDATLAHAARRLFRRVFVRREE